MNDFHITIISPNKKHIEGILNAIEDTVAESRIGIINEPLNQLGTPPDSKSELEILIVDCKGEDPAELEPIERLSKLYRNMFYILFSENQSPQFLLRAMRSGVNEVLAFPAKPEELSDSLNRIISKGTVAPERSGKVLTFVSCKGGSGATFLACNLAYELSQKENVKVALFDLNLHFGDALLFLSNQLPSATLLDVAEGIHRLDKSLLSSSMVHISPNLSVLAAPEDPSRVDEITPDKIDALIKLARTQFDFIVIDVGRNLNTLTIKALDLADVIFPVVQMTLPFIRDGKRLMDTFSNLDYPKSKINLVVNRFEKGNDIQLHHLEQGLSTKVTRTIPNHFESVAASVNQGVPITKLTRSSPVSKALFEWGTDLTTNPSKKIDEGWMKRTFKKMF